MDDLSGTPTTPALDPSRLASLHEIDPTLVADVASLWIETTPKLLTALVDACATGDVAAATTAAHTLRGSSANVGADQLAAACAVAEDAGRGGQLPGVRSALPLIQSEYTRAAAALGELATA